ncbi:SAC3/GANP/Nin1/mts3/eIF-3 p25 [Macleaya cordata]|uniref:SAC3/GANP/Nin1/mts3/eIF-3 p25 n=1 Tax=Macleaya cordata TaxID=56857 RepID=A0A200QLU7_MACCD|nr:SAC3/GANP/Nin1/mts3/eIF-3 p25 [Macleaya cordata]
MAFGGFGKNTGPSLPPRTQPQFGNFPNSPSPPIFPTNNAPQQRSPRLETGTSFLIGSGVSEAPQRVQSPSLALGSNSPGKGLSRPSGEALRPTVSPPSLGNRPKSPLDSSNFQSHQRLSPVESYAASRNAATSVTARPVNSQGPKRTRSPPFTHEAFLEDPTGGFAGRLGTRTDLLLENGGPITPQRMWPPTFAFERSRVSYEDLDNPVEEVQRSNTKIANFQVPKSTRSPPLPSTNKVLLRDSIPPLNDPERRVSPPRLGDKSNFLGYNSNPQTKQKSSKLVPNIAECTGTKPINSHVPKRTRSPSSRSAEELLPGNSHASQDDTEREVQAKAKRLARFKVELNQPAESSHDVSKNKLSGNRHDQALVERRKFVAEQPGEAAGDFILDAEGLESSSVIVGLCPDMCPESERNERERKGDLDKYERVDGDRNQTSETLAVKKYNRTAEREVDLIRPMPVLQKTVDYLLDLLDQPYDDSFLGLYNFLWDRMRAVRMDLRMQHIFNHDAIAMLERMIRLHIIAMHELCEYTKGEGFSEGFDAHLNIEQMNKTSVELFQMYDDHRKKGTNVPSEKEFRGYYALLKLDKHPGYKVEPAELSLDLAKMTPEIRQTPEILFARDVARACRTGNFIAFFRLARKATYLQACLMHAHFAKLRTQALASLHSGLQNNQGIPIGQVTRWLGMEGEDIESFLEYHGFMIKEFEEPYMVKDGAFLSSDKDYPTKCSQLVLLKKSRTILEDVSFDQAESPAKEVKKVISDKSPKAARFVKTKGSLDEEMLDFKDDSSTRLVSQVQPVFVTPLTTNQSGSDHQVSEMSSIPWNVPSSHFAPSLPATIRRVTEQDTPPNHSLEMSPSSYVKPTPRQTVSRTLSIDRSQGSYVDSLVKNSAHQAVVITPQENVVAMIVPQEVEIEEFILTDEEVEDEEAKMVQQEIEAATAKLKLILRMWKRRSSKQRELREQQQLATNAALNSLSLGPPIRQNKTQLTHVGELNIDRVLRERSERHGRSWLRLNVSEVVASILSERNPDAKCLCWKLILCSQMRSTQTNPAGPWLLSKLMGIRNENDDELAVSSPGLSVWKKWVISGSSNPPLCCLSIIRDVEGDKSVDAVSSASAVLFLVSNGIPWELQKTALNDLLMSLPSGSRLPLLILSDLYEEQVQNLSSTIVNELGLHYMDKSRISSFSIVYLLEDQLTENLDGFFSNDRLMEGLQWLADQSPLQPVLHCLKTRELVMGHLNYSLESLEKMKVSLVGPNDCISAFNSALDRAAEEVSTAADMNSTCWPCTEIDLLEEYTNERRAVESFLPSAGWSKSASIGPIINTIQNCKLPVFADDLFWLNHGSDMGKDIQNQKLELEKCLIMYLVHSSKLMEWELATTEAGVMLQKGAQLELHGVNFRIIPRWVVIFRRVFNWRLMNLISGTSSVAYVLANQREFCAEPCHMISPLKSLVRERNMGVNSPISKGVDELRLDGDRSPPYALTRPSLDEMVEVSCSPLPFGRSRRDLKTIQPLPLNFDEDGDTLETATTSDSMENNRNLRQEGEFTERDGSYVTDNYLPSRSMVDDNKEKNEADRLSKLLERCNMQQDMIDEKLFIYF